jgi:M6 family metalloprotease-like protein
MKKLLLSTVFLAGMSLSLYAVPALNRTILKTLPNGNTLEIQLNGDENFHYTTLPDGTLITEADNGYFYYATINTETNEITATPYRVDLPLPSKAKASNASTESVARQLEQMKQTNLKRRMVPHASRPTKLNAVNADHGVVILANFKDVKFKYTKEDYEKMLNEEGYSDYSSTGSARDYFIDSSYGKFSPTFEVYGPYDLSKNMSDYGGNVGGNDRNPTGMVVEVCKLAEADGVDFSKYDTDNDGYVDNVYVFYAGEGEANGGSPSTIWPHRWVIDPTYSFSGTKEDTKVSGVYLYDYACSNEICEENQHYIGNDLQGVGTFIHEYGHVLGLPDLYNTSYGNTRTLEIYDVMDCSNYLNYGRTPVSYSAYERMFCEWVTPEQIFPDGNSTQVELPLIAEGKVLLITANGKEHNMDGKNPDPNEFYLLENKPDTGWDYYANVTASPNYAQKGDKGMLITRVKYVSFLWDNNMVNNNSSNMGVSYVTNSTQTYPYYYPMFPGKRNATSITFGNYEITDIVRDDETGKITFNIRNTKMSGIDNVTTAELKATGTNGAIEINGEAATSVFTVQGTLVYQGSNQRIEAAPGMYIVRMTAADGKTYTQKVIVR